MKMSESKIYATPTNKIFSSKWFMDQNWDPGCFSRVCAADKTSFINMARIFSTSLWCAVRRSVLHITSAHQRFVSDARIKQLYEGIIFFSVKAVFTSATVSKPMPRLWISALTKGALDLRLISCFNWTFQGCRRMMVDFKSLVLNTGESEWVSACFMAISKV